MRADSQNTQNPTDTPVPAATSIPGRSRTRAVGRLLWRLLLIAWFVAGGAFLVLRYAVLPEIDRWRDDIAQDASAALGMPVSIGTIAADWSSFRPRLHLQNIVLDGPHTLAALHLDQVDATLAWSSLLRLTPYFHLLEIRAPTLHVSRDASGVVSVAGIALDPAAGDKRALAWLLGQRQIVVHKATVIWSDAQRAVPPLMLTAVDLRLVKGFTRHRAALRFIPQAEIAAAVDLRAALRADASVPITQWSGALYGAVSGASFAALAPWIDLPGELAGRGDATVWAQLDSGRIEAATADVALQDATVRLGDNLPHLSLDTVNGRISASRGDGRLTVSTRALSLVAGGDDDEGERVKVAPTDLELTLDTGDAAHNGRISANQLDIAALSALAAYLPFDAATRERLASFAPRGRLLDVSGSWTRSGEALSAWQVRAKFEDIGLKPRDRLPGLTGVDGQIDGDQDGGRYRLRGDGATLALPAVFVAPLEFDTLFAEGGWTRRDGRAQITLDSAQFANADAHGDASGHYLLSPDGPGSIDMLARLAEADGTAVWRYMPLVVNDNTRGWLKRSITAAAARDVRLRLEGDLKQFPFTDGNGTFLITGRFSDGQLDYVDGWPAIAGIEGGLRFDAATMQITASRGKIFGVDLRDVLAEIPVLGNHDEILTITGKAAGPTKDFLRFVSDSPVRNRINGFTDDMRADGDGALDLTLALPLHRLDDSSVGGRYRFSGNRLTVVPGLAPIEAAAGRVEFSAKSLSIPEARGTLLGAPMRLSARTEGDGAVVFEANGAARMSAAEAYYGWPLLDHLSGETPWTARVDVRGGQSTVRVDAPLSGVASSLPAPLNKSASTAMPASVNLTFRRDQSTQVDVTLGDIARFDASVPRAKDGWQRMAGGLGIGAPARRASNGLMVSIDQPRLDVDAWRDVMGGGSADGESLPLAGIALQTGQLDAFGYTLHNLRVDARRDGGTWSAKVRSREAEGTVDWAQQDAGAVHARFARLMLGKTTTDADNAEARVPDVVESLPALDIVAERFGMRGLDLGRLELQAVNRDGLWHLNRFALGSEQGELTGSGVWRAKAPMRTDLDFVLTTPDAGVLLKRLGYPDAVRGGDVSMTGKLGWRGAPTTLDYDTMSGQFSLLAKSGQFRKLDPGVGRLLGVLSLQSLPRRITLDFRDIFSEGFAFDRISGSIDVEQGVLRTDPLEIRGPAARIFLRGSASVPDETQDLTVMVQPTLSESIAIAAAVGAVNPVAGVVTYLAQKALQDPVEKLFAFQYAVSGTWDDPKVEKIDRTAPPQDTAPVAPTQSQ